MICGLARTYSQFIDTQLRDMSGWSCGRKSGGENWLRSRAPSAFVGTRGTSAWQDYFTSYHTAYLPITTFFGAQGRNEMILVCLSVCLTPDQSVNVVTRGTSAWQDCFTSVCLSNAWPKFSVMLPDYSVFMGTLGTSVCVARLFHFLSRCLLANHNFFWCK